MKNFTCLVCKTIVYSYGIKYYTNYGGSSKQIRICGKCGQWLVYQSYLYPNSIEFIKNHPEFDNLSSKAKTVIKYAFPKAYKNFINPKLTKVSNKKPKKKLKKVVKKQIIDQIPQPPKRILDV